MNRENKKRNSIWKQCKSKYRYKDEHEAYAHARKYSIERGTELDYYPCPYCNGWHLTSVTNPEEKYKKGHQNGINTKRSNFKRN